MNQLPDKLSDCLELALADLEKCEADPRYRILMSEWHEPLDSGQCAVCLAGSVMAQTIGLPIENSVDFSDFDEHTQGRLCALNSLRCGGINEALKEVGIENQEILSDYACVRTYGTNPAAFKSDMRGIVALLREHSL